METKVLSGHKANLAHLDPKACLAQMALKVRMQTKARAAYKAILDHKVTLEHKDHWDCLVPTVRKAHAAHKVRKQAMAR